MRFTSLHISDFRGARDLEIAFEPDLTVIVGRNGAGKTSIPDALAMTIGLACSRSREPGRSSFDFDVGPSARDVREGASSSRLDVEYELGDRQPGQPLTDTLALTIDSYGAPPDFAPRQDAEVLARLASSPPRLVYYRQARGFDPRGRDRPANSIADIFDPDAIRDDSYRTDSRVIGDLEAWWDRRDAQEARRVRDGQRDYRDPQLEAIRNLVAKIDGFLGIAFDSTASPPGLHFVKNDGTPVHVSGLSGGERSYIILLADLARRLQLFAPVQPLDEISAIVLIDEIELNLHPGWQSEIVPTLGEVFRGCQLIVTTHSPQVLSGVESGKVRIIEEEVPDWSWRVTVPLSTRGRTSNYLLEGVLGARERFPPIDTLIDTFNAAIDRGDVAEAANALEEIEREIGDDAPTLLVLFKKRLRRASQTTYGTS